MGLTDEINIAHIDVLKILKSLKIDLSGKYIVPVSVEQFLQIEKYLGNEHIITKDGYTVDNAFPHFERDGQLCKFFFKDMGKGESWEILTLDAILNIHSDSPMEVLVLVGLYETNSWIFNKNLHKPNTIWPSSEIEIIAVSKEIDKLSYVEMTMEEYLSIDKIVPIYHFSVYGKEVGFRDNGTLNIDKNHNGSYCCILRSGDKMDISISAVVTIAVKDINDFALALSNLRKGM